MQVPYLDLRRQYRAIKPAIDNALHETIESCAFVAGTKVRQFEESFARYCSVQHAIGVSCGTSALYIALKALGVGSGDIVLTVPFTFIATVEAITLTGALPAFIDIETDSYTISPSALQRYCEKRCRWSEDRKELIDTESGLRVRAIVPVHLYGQVVDMDEIMDISSRYHLFVVEDAAQAHGATYKQKKAGSLGHLGCFSFYPSKNLGAFGQGGAIVTNDGKYAERIRLFINHGQKGKYKYHSEGWNYKMDGFQAAILDVKLQHLDTWNRIRRQHAQLYSDTLRDLPNIVLPKEKSDRQHVFHLYVIHVSDRESFEKHLQAASIGYTIAYPIPLHLQEAYADLRHKAGDFPNTEHAAQGVIALPIFPELTTDEIDYVCKSVRTWANGQ